VKYLDGQEVRLWDRVEWSGSPGLIVLSVDADEYSPRYPKESWASLGPGVMIDTQAAGLVHTSDPDEDLRLIRRGGEPSAAEIASLRNPVDQ
jgi:hypothetical protein